MSIPESSFSLEYDGKESLVSLESTMVFSPLAGLKVLDLSQGVAGPYCAQILADQGAEVIKVEPAQGDWGRHVGMAANGHSTISTTYNRGKKSVAIDAKHPQGKALLLELAAQADVIVQNFRPQVVQRLGLDYESLVARGMQVVYLSISGYGADGPYAENPATDSVMQADTGLMHTNRTAQGDPQRVGFLLADIATGVYAAQACTAALLERLRTGQGRHVELNLFEVCCALQSTAVAEDMARVQSGQTSAPQAVSAPNGVFDAADGKISILALNNDQFARIATALDLAHWSQDPRFASNDLRLQHKAVLHAELAATVQHRSLEDLESCFQQHSVLHARIRTSEQVVQHPQAVHLGTFHQLQQPGMGVVQVAALPCGDRTATQLPAPRIGEHTVQVLQRLGKTDTDIQALLAAQAIAC